jgi:hypothetical protein
MDVLKKIFPFSFKSVADVAGLIINILIYIVVAIIAAAVIWLATFITAWIPVVGALIAWVLGLLGSLIDLYCVAGIVILILVYTKVIKD